MLHGKPQFMLNQLLSVLLLPLQLVSEKCLLSCCKTKCPVTLAAIKSTVLICSNRAINKAVYSVDTGS